MKGNAAKYFLLIYSNINANVTLYWDWCAFFVVFVPVRRIIHAVCSRLWPFFAVLFPSNSFLSHIICCHCWSPHFAFYFVFSSVCCLDCPCYAEKFPCNFPSIHYTYEHRAPMLPRQAILIRRFLWTELSVKSAAQIWIKCIFLKRFFFIYVNWNKYLSNS